jgi:hypothetical protein
VGIVYLSTFLVGGKDPLGNDHPFCSLFPVSLLLASQVPCLFRKWGRRVAATY